MDQSINDDVSKANSSTGVVSPSSSTGSSPVVVLNTDFDTNTADINKRSNIFNFQSNDVTKRSNIFNFQSNDVTKRSDNVSGESADEMDDVIDHLRDVKSHPEWRFDDVSKRWHRPLSTPVTKLYASKRTGQTGQSESFGRTGQLLSSASSDRFLNSSSVTSLASLPLRAEAPFRRRERIRKKISAPSLLASVEESDNGRRNGKTANDGADDDAVSDFSVKGAIGDVVEGHVERANDSRFDGEVDNAIRDAAKDAFDGAAAGNAAEAPKGKTIISFDDAFKMAKNSDLDLAGFVDAMTQASASLICRDDADARGSGDVIVAPSASSIGSGGIGGGVGDGKGAGVDVMEESSASRQGHSKHSVTFSLSKENDVKDEENDVQDEENAVKDDVKDKENNIKDGAENKEEEANFQKSKENKGKSVPVVCAKENNSGEETNSQDGQTCRNEAKWVSTDETTEQRSQTKRRGSKDDYAVVVSKGSMKEEFKKESEEGDVAMGQISSFLSLHNLDNLDLAGMESSYAIVSSLLTILGLGLTLVRLVFCPELSSIYAGRYKVRFDESTEIRKSVEFNFVDQDTIEIKQYEKVVNSDWIVQRRRALFL